MKQQLICGEPGGVSPMALTLRTRSVSEGDDKRRFPLFPSLTLRVTGGKVSAIGLTPPRSEIPP